MQNCQPDLQRGARTDTQYRTVGKTYREVHGQTRNTELSAGLTERCTDRHAIQNCWQGEVHGQTRNTELSAGLTERCTDRHAIQNCQQTYRTYREVHGQTRNTELLARLTERCTDRHAIQNCQLDLQKCARTDCGKQHLVFCGC